MTRAPTRTCLHHNTLSTPTSRASCLHSKSTRREIYKQRIKIIRNSISCLLRFSSRILVNTVPSGDGNLTYQNSSIHSISYGLDLAVSQNSDSKVFTLTWIVYIGYPSSVHPRTVQCRSSPSPCAPPLHCQSDVKPNPRRLLTSASRTYAHPQPSPRSFLHTSTPPSRLPLRLSPGSTDRSPRIAPGFGSTGRRASEVVASWVNDAGGVGDSVVVKKKTRGAFDRMKWGALGEVMNVPAKHSQLCC